MDAAVADFTTLFEKAMEVVTSLLEDPTMQLLSTKIYELQQQYDEVRATSRAIATTQRLTELQEAKKLLAQVEVAQKRKKSLRPSWALGWTKPHSSRPTYRNGWQTCSLHNRR